MKKNRRRRYLIEGNFQLRFILRFVLVIIGATLLSTGAIIGVFYFKYKFGGADLNNLIIMVTPEGTTNVASLFEIVLVPLIGANLLMLAIIIPFSFLYSHKIAGPVYRLEQSIDLLLSGNTDFMIMLRKKDEFKYLADKMNALVDYLRRNIGEVKISYRMVNERVNRIYNLLSSGTPDIDIIKNEIEQLYRFFSERKTPFSY